MFDLGFAELLVIGIVALIVVGPKDLPVMFRRAGQFVGRMRGMAREFSTAMNQAADESGVRDIQKTLKTATHPVGAAMDEMRSTASGLANLDPNSETGKLAAERARNAARIQAAAARAQAERKAREASEALERAEALEAQASQTAANASVQTDGRSQSGISAPAPEATDE